MFQVHRAGLHSAEQLVRARPHGADVPVQLHVQRRRRHHHQPQLHAQVGDLAA